MTRPRKRKTTFGLNEYYKPTPVHLRKLGDSLLAGATVVAIGGLWDFKTLTQYFTPEQVRFFIGASIVLGIVGKILSNLFSNDSEAK
jgi:hypothetical protein